MFKILINCASGLFLPGLNIFMNLYPPAFRWIVRTYIYVKNIENKFICILLIYAEIRLTFPKFSSGSSWLFFKPFEPGPVFCILLGDIIPILLEHSFTLKLFLLYFIHCFPCLL